jgi:hypothetical protein
MLQDGSLQYKIFDHILSDKLIQKEHQYRKADFLLEKCP